jgi:hypothetical protein
MSRKEKSLSEVGQTCLTRLCERGDWLFTGTHRAASILVKLVECLSAPVNFLLRERHSSRWCARATLPSFAPRIWTFNSRPKNIFFPFFAFFFSPSFSFSLFLPKKMSNKYRVGMGGSQTDKIHSSPARYIFKERCDGAPHKRNG